MCSAKIAAWSKRTLIVGQVLLAWLRNWRTDALKELLSRIFLFPTYAFPDFRMNLRCFPSNSRLTLLPSVPVFQWKAARTGRWTTWNTRCFWGSLYGLSALCSMDIYGPTTRTRRAPDSASCGTKARDTGTLRSPLASTARGWARRRTPYGFGRRSWTTWGTTPACWGKSCWKLLSSNVYCCFYWFLPSTASRSWRMKQKTSSTPLYLFCQQFVTKNWG